MDYRVGAGGWAYFQVPGEDPLEAYGRAFDFVEVNSTFYEHPREAVVRGWRRRVPKGFEFALRCHRFIGDSSFAPTPANASALRRAVRFAEILDAEFLHLLWPGKVKTTVGNVSNLRRLLEAVDLGRRVVALEARGPDRGVPPTLVALMEDLGLVHAVDLSREAPVADSSYLYARLFGRGEGNRYQFTDAELEEIDDRAEETGARKALFTFHGVRMYKDAGRFASFRRTGSFPPITRGRGGEALREVLLDDARFPATKAELIQHHGWKVLETSSGTQARVEAVLGALPGGRYGSVNEVLEALGPKV
jgi:uncharacterized protein YecE (DUF72 family)